MVEQAQIDELKQKMAEERDRLLAALERLNDGEAAKPTSGEGEWSAKQQMAHLCEMETAYRAWWEGAPEDGASVDGVRGEHAIRFPKLTPTALASTSGRCAPERETFVLIDSLRSEDFERTARRRCSDRSRDAVVALILPHDRMHYDQVRGVDPEYKPGTLAAKSRTSDARDTPTKTERLNRSVPVAQSRVIDYTECIFTFPTIVAVTYRSAPGGTRTRIFGVVNTCSVRLSYRGTAELIPGARGDNRQMASRPRVFVTRAYPPRARASSGGCRRRGLADDLPPHARSRAQGTESEGLITLLTDRVDIAYRCDPKAPRRRNMATVLR